MMKQLPLRTLLMHILLVLLCFAGQHGTSSAQSLYFPPATGNQWDTLSPSALGWQADRLEDLYDYLEVSNTKAFIVLKDGKILFERYFGTFTADSLWYWASAGKSLTSFLIGLAQEDSMLALDDTVSSYLGSGWTSTSPSQEQKITIRHQLTMTTGLDDDVPDPDCTLPSCLLYKAEPGTRWAYHNAPYTLLDEVVQAASGISMNSIIAQQLQPVTGFSGLYLPLGSNNVFFSKPRMMARFGLLVLNRGVWNSTTIMSDTSYFHQMVNTSQTMNQAYGYLWWLNGKSSFMVPGFQFQFPGSLCPNAPANMIMALGKNGQILNVVPGENLVLVRMGNPTASAEISVAFNDSIWQLLNMARPVGLNEPTDLWNAGLRIVPNPVRQSFILTSVSGLDAHPLHYQIFNNHGALVAEGDAIKGKEINISVLNAGIYIIRVIAQDGSGWHSKLIRI
jgi:CubicO group peptidase (beta-lactamase class C family)